jgi:hypothetical protein
MAVTGYGIRSLKIGPNGVALEHVEFRPSTPPAR